MKGDLKLTGTEEAGIRGTKISKGVESRANGLPLTTVGVR